ncbi:MAG: dihydroxy-acid dehydratase [Lachnospiraceae bacterium]
MTNEDSLRPYNHSIKADDSIAVLMGSLAPEGSFIRHAACRKDVFKAVLHARPFDSEKEGRTPFLLRPENPSFIPIVDGFGFLLFIE